MQITYSNHEILNVVIPLTCFRAYQTYALFLKTLHVWQDYSKYIRDLVFFSFFSFSCQLFTTFRERLLILITFEQNCFFPFYTGGNSGKPKYFRYSSQSKIFWISKLICCTNIVLSGSLLSNVFVMLIYFITGVEGVTRTPASI